MLCNDPCSVLGGVLSPDTFDKITFWIHDVKINTVVDQVIFFTRFDVWWSTEVHAVLFANVLHLFPSSCEALKMRVEFAKVGPEDCRGVTEWVAGYKNRSEDIGMGLREGVEESSEFIEFVGAYIGTVAEAEIYNAVFAQQILFCELIAIQICHGEGSPDFGSAIPFTHFGDSLSFQPTLLVLEIYNHSGTRGEEKSN